MTLSAPIYSLKRQAKVLSRNNGIPLHQALDQVAIKEGFSRWSLLIAQISEEQKTIARTIKLAPKSVFSSLSLGELMLIGARPGHGKTSFSLQLVVEAMKSGDKGVFFTLEYNEVHMLNLFRKIGEDPMNFRDHFKFYASDLINAEYIISKLLDEPTGTFVVVDYLQLLDQKRDNPELMLQISALKSFAEKQKLRMVFTSQIDRSFNSSSNICPSFEDVRLPNTLDLTLFNKACFINDKKFQIAVPT